MLLLLFITQITSNVPRRVKSDLQWSLEPQPGVNSQSTSTRSRYKMLSVNVAAEARRHQRYQSSETRRCK